MAPAPSFVDSDASTLAASLASDRIEKAREEQQEEREVLDSIFPDEITDISDTAYRISIALEGPSNASEDDDPPPPLLLSVNYPPTYPEVAPRLDITNLPNAPRYLFLDLQNDKPYLLSSLEPTIEESLGAAMVFTLAMALKETAETLIRERAEAAEAHREKEAQKVEEEENRKFVGEVMTKERFLVWREAFRKEVEEAEEKRKAEDEASKKGKAAAKGEEKKVSGRQLWESGLGGKEEPGEAQEELVEGIEGIRV